MGKNNNNLGVISEKKAFLYMNFLIPVIVVLILLTTSFSIIISLSDGAQADSTSAPEIDYLAIDVEINNN